MPGSSALNATTADARGSSNSYPPIAIGDAPDMVHPVPALRSDLLERNQRDKGKARELDPWYKPALVQDAAACLASVSLNPPCGVRENLTNWESVPNQSRALTPLNIGTSSLRHDHGQALEEPDPILDTDTVPLQAFVRQVDGDNIREYSGVDLPDPNTTSRYIALQLLLNKRRQHGDGDADDEQSDDEEPDIKVCMCLWPISYQVSSHRSLTGQLPWPCHTSRLSSFL